MNWPRMYRRKGWWGEPGGIEKVKDRDKNIQAMSLLFKEAEAYGKLSNPKKVNLKLAAMTGLFDGSKGLFISTNYVKEIMEAVKFAVDHGVKKIVIVGGKDSWMITDFLKQYNVAVVLNRIHSSPSRHEDDIDISFKIPFLLKEAGILYCLRLQDGSQEMQTRNLPFLAGTSAAYGLTKEEALMSITSNAAKILGIDQTVGTIEEGKDGTIIVSAGDALDMMTNNIEHAFIRGKQLDLNDHQKILYHKYRAKYGLE